MKRRVFAWMIVLILVFGLTTSAAAQEYSFSLDQETVHALWNSDGTLSLDYTFIFTNDPGAHIIDFVDVGMPNGSYDSSSITADVDGNSVSISSDYKGEGSYGFAVDLGTHAIQPGQRGTVHVWVGRISNMLYPDTNEPETYASGEFSPTWFGASNVHGTTDLTVVFHLPPGVKPEEPRYHAPGDWPGSVEPNAALDGEGRVTYTWHSPDVNGYTQYTFGASFPQSYIPATAIVKSQPIQFDLESLTGCLCPAIFIGIFAGIPILGVINARRRKIQYLPPKISIEGHGIKRGLTAVEAAILMEQPLDKVMTMILFSGVKKGATTVTSRDPLKLQLTKPLPEGLHEYEANFLNAFEGTDLAAQRKALQEMTVKLVQSVSNKMKGFSRKETIDYYKSIMERAWQQIEAAGTPEVKSQMYEQALEWTMLDRDYDDRTRRVFIGPIYVPTWWGHYDPTYRPAAVPHAAKTSPATAPGGRVSMSSLPGANFAASVVTGVQNFSSRVIGNLNSFTSAVTNRTNPVPKVTTSSSGSGRSGGGGCACACACAGCACACAGGGR